MRGIAARTVTIWSAVTVAVALLVAAIPLLLFPDAGANDGAGPMTALAGIPMVATAVLLHLALLRDRDSRFIGRMLPWVVAIVIGTVVLAIPATLADRAYYTSETLAGMLATLAAFAGIALLGVGGGFVLWFIVLTPAASLVAAIAGAWRGEKVRPALIAIPATILAAEIVVVVLIVVSVGDVEELVAVQIVGVLFGIAGLAPETPVIGTWIVRGLLVAAVTTGILLTVSPRAAEDATA